MRQDKLLQKFKGPNETSVPSLDTALRRAAAFGSPDDIKALIALSAAING